MKKLPRPLSLAANFIARRSDAIDLALFAIAGAAILDDYGVSHEEGRHQRIRFISAHPKTFPDERPTPARAAASQSSHSAERRTRQ